MTGPRVVHGGEFFCGPVPLDDDRILAIEALTPLVPRHQPQALRVIRAIGHLQPTHPPSITQSNLVRRLAIPRRLHGTGMVANTYLEAPIARSIRLSPRMPRACASSFATARFYRQDTARWNLLFGRDVCEEFPQRFRHAERDK
ncbi:hypothetical protein LJR235_004851 [Pararhizobium sp. LjRoot235]|uniref:hypothetical protein n=1 Tax=Pararhizobium sp. LjRoot235 TaxID=3342291 RepID=UPI003ECDC12E